MTTPAKKRTRAGSILLVVGLLGLTIICTFLSRKSLHEAQKASASIYNDRLVPSGILVDLTSAVYRKRLLLETYVLTADKPEVGLIVSGLDRLNRRVDSLLTAFELTTLTSSESDRLQLLKQRLLVYNGLETELVTNRTGSPASLRTLFAGTGSAAFGKVAQTLDELSALQLTVGEKLLNESSNQTNYNYVLTALQIGLVLMTGLTLFWHRI